MKIKTATGGAVLLVASCVLGRCQTGQAAQAGKSPVKVFILAGQSNMQGDGHVGPADKKGTLEYVVRSLDKAGRFKHLVDKEGKWAVREDVWFFQRKTQRVGRGANRKIETSAFAGKLTAGLGGTAGKPRIGPELQFGHVMGDHFDNQVLLIKTAWGGKSLGLDFRPPSSGKLTAEISPKMREAIDNGKVEVGGYYRRMLAEVREVLKDLKKHFADYDGRGCEIVGFCWHQGWNDGCVEAFAGEYQRNLENFIRDIRKDLGVKDLPVVIASSGFGGHSEKLPGVRARIKRVVEPAQIAVGKKMENVTCVQTRDYFRPREDSPTGASYHWNSNAETYLLIGDAMGRAMALMFQKRQAHQKGPTSATGSPR